MCIEVQRRIDTNIKHFSESCGKGVGMLRGLSNRLNKHWKREDGGGRERM